MNQPQRLPAFIAYLLPVIGWIYLGIFQRNNQFARFHMRQAVGLFLFPIIVTIGWALGTWLLTWVPYLIVLGMALFSIPLATYIFSVIAWFIGMANALRRREAYLPIIGGYSSRLPF